MDYTRERRRRLRYRTCQYDLSLDTSSRLLVTIRNHYNTNDALLQNISLLEGATPINTMVRFLLFVKTLRTKELFPICPKQQVFARPRCIC